MINAPDPFQTVYVCDKCHGTVFVVGSQWYCDCSSVDSDGIADGSLTLPGYWGRPEDLYAELMGE